MSIPNRYNTINRMLIKRNTSACGKFVKICCINDFLSVGSVVKELIYKRTSQERRQLVSEIRRKLNVINLT